MISDTKAEIEKIIAIIVMPHDEDLKTTDSTIEDYFKYINSIRFIELITAIEQQFNIEISSEDLTMKSIGSIDTFTKMVCRYLSPAK